MDDNIKSKFECLICGKSYKYKSDFDRHMNRKIPCSDEKNRNTEESRTCKYCNKLYSRIDSLERHITVCKTRKEQEKKAENELKSNPFMMKIINDKCKDMEEKHKKLLQKELLKLREEFAKSRAEKADNAKNINIGGNLNNNIQNNIHNEIKIIAYGKEDTSYITDNEYELLINKGFKSVPNLVEYIHFNINKPENQNIYISNMRDNYVLVYDGEQWQMREREDILQDIIDNKTDILNEKFDELIDKLDEITIKRFKKFLNEKDNDNVSSQLKKDLKLILYNKKKVAAVKPRYIGVSKPKIINIEASFIDKLDDNTDKTDNKIIIDKIDDKLIDA